MLPARASHDKYRADSSSAPYNEQTGALGGTILILIKASLTFSHMKPDRLLIIPSYQYPYYYPIKY